MVSSLYVQVSIFSLIFDTIQLEGEHKGCADAWIGDKVYLTVELLDDGLANTEA